MPPDSVVGRRIWIHAGKTYDADGAVTCGLRGFAPAEATLPRGALIGDARLAGYVYRRAHGYRLVGQAPHAEDLMNSLWWVGPCGWVLDDVRELPAPRAVRGRQGLWAVDPALHVELVNTFARLGSKKGMTTPPPPTEDELEDQLASIIDEQAAVQRLGLALDVDDPDYERVRAELDRRRTALWAALKAYDEAAARARAPRPAAW
jgi:hypothetical protein